MVTLNVICILNMWEGVHVHNTYGCCLDVSHEQRATSHEHEYVSREQEHVSDSLFIEELGGKFS